jgi:hypothetical protein
MGTVPVHWSNIERVLYVPKTKQKNTPVSGGRKEDLQTQAEEDILLNRLADAKRPFLMAQFGVED